MSEPAGLRFVSWTRDGLAGSLRLSPGQASPTVTIKPTVSVTGRSIPLEQPKTHDAILYGPGDVTGIDQRQIIRVEPSPGAAAFEPHLMPFVEFDRPDFAWMFSPAVPDGVKLLPWLCLVVTTVAPRPLEGTPLPVITIPPSEPLPVLDEAWAWAHAQIASGAPAADLNTLLVGPPESTLSRLLAPRHLLADTVYHACLVPTFKAGVCTGLGRALDELSPRSAELAWSLERTSDIDLPVYYSWTFQTGSNGDFKTLTEKLKRRVLSGLGLREVNLGRPRGDPALDTALSGATGYLEGALRSLDAVPPSQLTKGQRTYYEGLLGDQLTSFKQHPAPLYGSAQARLNTTVPLPRQSPRWLTDLAYDPLQRLVAGLATQVIQRDQEALMSEAWDQATLAPANEMIGRAQISHALQTVSLAKRIPSAHGVASLDTLSVPGLLGLARPVVQKPAADPVLAVLTSPLFRRLGRPLGPLARRLPAASPPGVRAGASDEDPLPNIPVGPTLLPSGMAHISRKTVLDRLANADPTRRNWARKHPAGSDVVAAGFRTEIPQYVHWLVRWDIGSIADVLGQIGTWSAPAADVYQVGSTALYTAAVAICKTIDGAPPELPSQPDLLVFFLGGPEATGTYSPMSAAKNLDAQGNFQRPASYAFSWSDSGPTVASKSGVVSAPALATLGSPYVDAVLAFWVVDNKQVKCSLGHWDPVPYEGYHYFSWSAPQDAFPIRSDMTAVAAAAMLTDLTGEWDEDKQATKLDVVVAVLVRLDGGQYDVLVSLGQDVNVTGPVATVRTWNLPWQGNIGHGLKEPVGMTFTHLSGSGAPELVVCDADGNTSVAHDVLDPDTSRLWREVSHTQYHVPTPATTALGLAFGEMSSAAYGQRTGALQSLRTAMSRWLERWTEPPAPVSSPSLPKPFVKLPGTKLTASFALEPAARSKQLLRRTVLDARPGAWTRLGDRARQAPPISVSTVWSVLKSSQAGGSAGLGQPPLSPLLAAPRFDRPAYEALKELSSELLLPGLSTVPDETVGVLAANPVFTDAYLVGLNHEMTRELRWRGYNADASATYFRRFWDSSAAKTPQEIPPIADWADQALGASSQAATVPLVLVVRGELVRRFPHVNVYAQAAKNGSYDATAPRVQWAFHASLPPDTVMLGFNVTLEQALGTSPDGSGYYFVFEQEPTGIRFGLDERGKHQLDHWADLGWDQTGTDLGAYLSIAKSVEPLKAAGISAPPRRCLSVTLTPKMWPGAPARP